MSRLLLFIFSVGLLLVLYCSANEASTKTTIALTDLSGQGSVDKSTALVISDRLRSELFNTSAFVVLERGQMQDILKEQGFQQTGCTSDACIVEAGQLLGVKFIIAGSLGKVGSTYTLNLRMIDVETGKIIRAANSDCRCEIDDVLSRTTVDVASKMANIAIGNSSQQVLKTIPNAIRPKFISSFWQIASGAFDFSESFISASSSDANYIWYREKIPNMFTLTFTASPSHMVGNQSDFRINLFSNTSTGIYDKGTYYQVLLPWEGGDSRADYFNNGFNYHVLNGKQYISESSYAVKIVSNPPTVDVYVNDRSIMSFETTVNSQNFAYFGFAYYKGFSISDLKILIP
jgi:TolB-like protein